MTSCKKGKWENFCFVITDPTLVNTSTSATKNTGKYDSIGDKKEKSTCTHKTS